MKANEMTERIRAAVEKNPRKMTLQLARDLGVPEVEVIRAFPADRVTELDIARWEELLRSFEALGSVRVLVSNGATTIEVDGQFGGFSTAGEFFNVQTDTLDMHIRWAAIGRRVRRGEARPHGRHGHSQLSVLRPDGCRRLQGLPQLRRPDPA